MAAKCYNTNDPGFQELMRVYNNYYVVSAIVDEYQSRTKTDDFPSTIQASTIMRDIKATPTSSLQDPVRAIENNLIKKGFAHRLNGKLFITQSPKNARHTIASVRDRNLRAAINYLQANRITEGMYRVIQHAKSVSIQILPERVKDYIPQSAAVNNLSPLLNHLKSTIPGVTIKIVSPAEAKAIHDTIADWQKTDVNFDNVKSFYHKGTAYLIRGRVTNEIAVEEVLHPFVFALSVEKPELFQKLVGDAAIHFPALVQQIKNAYLGLKNFDARDMEIELVSQVLSRVVNKKFEETGTRKDLVDYINNFYEWFIETVKKYLSGLAGYATIDPITKVTTVKIKDLNQDLSFKKLAEGILTEALSFDVDITLDDKVRYNIQKDLRPYVEQVYKNGTQQQKDVIDTVIFNNPNQVTLVDKTHTYYDQDGVEYTSVTTKMKGTLPAEKEIKNSLNLLFGNQIDALVESFTSGRTFEEAKEEAQKMIAKTNARRQDLGLPALTADQGISDDLLEKIYNELVKVFADEENGFQDNAIIIPQVIVSDPTSMVAGSVDLLVINPDGTAEVVDIKASKNSINKKFVTDSGVEVSSYNTSYVQTDGAFKGQRLSTKAQHAIQVGSYAEMLYALGVNVVRTRTMHVNVIVPEGQTGDNQTVTDLVFEGSVDHSVSGNREHIAKIVTVTDNVRTKDEAEPIGSSQTKSESTAREEATKEAEDNKDNPALVVELNNILGELQLRKGQLERMLSQKKGFSSQAGKSKREQSIVKLTVLMNAVRQDIEDYALLNGTQLNAAVGRLTEFAIQDLESFEKYASNPNNYGKPEFASIILSYSKFLETYTGVENLISKVNSTNQKRLIELKAALDSAGTLLDKSFTEFAAAFVTNNTLNTDLTESDIRAMLEKTIDINKADALLESMAASSDTVLALIDKIYKAQKAKLMFENDLFVQEANEKGNALLAASKAAGIKDADAYMFMFSKNQDGKLNGRYVQKIGYQYWEKLYALRAETLDEEGKPAQYKKTDTLKGQELKDAISYNIKLYAAKKVYNSFKNAEKITENGFEDGDYHRYSNEFKTARAQYADFRGGRWRPKAGVTAEEYAGYLNKYFRKAPPYMSPIVVEGKFTGEVREVKDRYFVRDEYIEIREQAATGENMLDSAYEEIMKPTDALGQARKDYYDWWTNQHEKGSIASLPRDIESSITGKIPRIQKNFFNKIKDMDEGRGAAILKMVGKLVNVFGIKTKVYPKVYQTDEAGDLVRTPPVFFTADLKSQKRIDSLKTQLEELVNQKKAGEIGIKEYLAERKRLSGILTAEENKITPDDINTDMTQNLIAFRTMASNFEAMNAVEDTILALKKIIDQREYTPAGGELSQKVTAKGREILSMSGEKKMSNVQDRLNNWLEMTFYNEGAFEKSVAEQLVSTVLKYTSLTYVGFNPFSALNNIIYGRISNAIETAGAQFYDRRAIMRSTKELNIALGGFMQGLGSKAAFMTGPDKYRNHKPNSKYEALVDHFKMIRKYQSGEGREGISDVLSFGYWMQEGGEYMIQSKTGVAMLMSKQLTNSITGETSSIYDALDYDQATGKVSVKDGFEFTEDQRAELSRNIWGMNEYIHGNYADEDKMVIQKYSLGLLAAQFHKWVWPSFKARFKKSNFDERFGVYTEGRYRTMVKMLGYVWGAHGSIKERYKEANGVLTPTEIANIQKTLAEIGFFLGSLAVFAIFRGLKDGVDDDDKELKRLLGLLQFQADRTQSEITTFVDPTEYARLLKNPIASSRSLGEFAEAINYSADYFLTPDREDKYYQRTERKGDPKFIKQWEDALPVVRSINRWKSFDSVERWYIKD